MVMQISADFAKDLARAELWVPWVLRAVRVVVILAGAWLLTRLARRLLRRLRTYTIRLMDRRGEASALELEKRATTIISVLSKLASMVIWIVALVMALNELAFNIQPLLAGLGVAGLAVGLGAQALIKDWLGGLLVLLEDQIRIGDSVVINGIAGTVEEINLRTTVLRGENGAVHIISNGLITTLSNMTREYAYYVFEATLAHRSDVDRALSIVQETGVELAVDDVYRTMILAPIEVMGVDRLAERGLVIRARIKTVPAKTALVGRELNRRVSARLASAQIEFPPATGA
jgi:moderate conductance mechanosensitive channel